MKKLTENGREEKRAKSLELSNKYKKQGDSLNARKKFAESIDVTPDMAYKLIAELEKHCVEFFVAPYEADAQLAYLCKIGYVDFVITEDSDLLVYGARRVFYKMDNEGYGVEICLDRLHLCKDFDFSGFTGDMFLETCILAGCDYLPSIPGIAFKKAHKHMKEFRNYKKVII
jgi:exonuclease-1